MLSIVFVTALGSATVGGLPPSSCGCNGPAPTVPVVTGEVYYEAPTESGLRGFFHRLFHRHQDEIISYDAPVIVPAAPATGQPLKPIPTAEPIPLPKDAKAAPEK